MNILFLLSTYPYCSKLKISLPFPTFLEFRYSLKERHIEYGRKLNHSVQENASGFAEAGVRNLGSKVIFGMQKIPEKGRRNRRSLDGCFLYYFHKNQSAKRKSRF